MNISELINEILSEWAYRVNDGMPNPKNEFHITELSNILSEMGLLSIKNELLENLKEDDKSFSNPVLNKKITYKDKEGKNKEGIVGNLLRQPKGTPARDAAEKVLPPEGSPERDALNKDLGGEGQPTKPEDGADKDGGDANGGTPKEDPIQKAAQMFDPKADPAMAARLDKEKETQSQIAADAEKDKEEKTKEEPKKDDGFNPIASVDVKDEIPQADPDAFGGQSDIPDGIGDEELKDFNTDIQKVKSIVDDAKAKGEKAPNINLCQITVPGTNLYCDDNLGIPRAEMPQFKGKPQPGTPAADMPVDKDGEVDTEPLFKKMLGEKGIKVVQTEVPADKLKATQSELVGAKVVGMMGALEENPEHPKITAPIYVSRDGYVIDGHHRWAAVAAYNAAHPDSQIPMKVQVIDQDIKDAIPMCNKFAEEQGVAAKKADANKETDSKPVEEKPKKVSSFTKMTDAIKNKISKWQESEKEFFKKGYYKAGSEPRRTIGQTIKDKAKGALDAIKHGAQHEIKEFKTAGMGIKNFFSGKPISEDETKAIKNVAFKVATTAIFGAAMGGLSHGAGAFAKHLAAEFVPHVIAETLLKGTARAAIFADNESEAEMEANMEKFMEMIAKGIEDMDISEEQMEAIVDSYNENKDKGETDNMETPQMKEELFPMIDKLIESIINEFIKEAPLKTNSIYKAISNKTDKVVDFQSKEAMEKAIKKGTHRAIKSSKSKATDKPATPTIATDKGVQARVDREKAALEKDKKKKEPTAKPVPTKTAQPKKAAPSGKLSNKMEEDDMYFPKKKIADKLKESGEVINKLPMSKDEKKILLGIVGKALKGEQLLKAERKFAADWVTFPATSDPKIYFAPAKGEFKTHISVEMGKGIPDREAFNEYLEQNEIFDAGHAVKKKSMVASKLTGNRTKVKVDGVKKDKNGKTESCKIGNTTFTRYPEPSEQELLKEFKAKGIPNADEEVRKTLIAIKRHNDYVEFIAAQQDIETIDFGYETDTPDGRKNTIESVKKMMFDKLNADFGKFFKGKVPSDAKNVLNLIKGISNPYNGISPERMQTEIDAIARLMNANPEFRAGVPDMQEIFDFMVKLGQGYAGFMPSASNWKVTDIVTYKPSQQLKIKTGESPASAIANNFQALISTALIEGGLSVKYEKGGASAGYDKVMMTVYKKHKNFDTQKEIVTLFDTYKWSFTPGEENRVKSAKEIESKEAELNSVLERAKKAGILTEEEITEIQMEGEDQAAKMSAKVDKKVPFKKYKQCFGSNEKEQKSNYENYKKQCGMWCKMGAIAEKLNNNDMDYQLFGNLRTTYPKKGEPKHETIDGVSTLSGMGWSYDPGIAATGKECKYLSLNNANSSHIEPVKRK